MSVPPKAVAASLAALGLHNPSTPVASIVGDSLLDDDVPHAPGTDRHLIFEHADIKAEILVTIHAGHRELRIIVIPDAFTEVRLVQPGLEAQFEAIREGHSLEVKPGMTSLELRRPADGYTFHTAWLVL